MLPTVILFYKPYGVISQFTPDGAWKTLSEFGPFPETVYPAGRLDADSEGLILLTDDNRIKRRITEPRYRHPRTYAVQVERVPDGEALEKLRRGVMIEGEPTRPADVRLLPEEPVFPPRTVPIRFRKNVPTAWIELTLTEGRNRQVRKMTAAVGHPALRLVRTGIGDLRLDGLSPGRWRNLSVNEIRNLRGTESPRPVRHKKKPGRSSEPGSKFSRPDRPEEQAAPEATAPRSGAGSPARGSSRPGKA